MRELRSIDPKGRTESELTDVKQRVRQLEYDINHALAISNKQIAERVKLNNEKVTVVQQLTETTKLTSYLESQLKRYTYNIMIKACLTIQV